MAETQPKDRRTREQLRDELAAARRPIVIRNHQGLTGPAALLAGGAIVTAYLLSGGGRFGVGSSEPTGSFSPTSVPTGESAGATRTATPTISEAPSASESATGLTKEQMQAAHEARLRLLDPIYRTQGTKAWLIAAGFNYDSLTFVKDARQIEEETLPDGTIVASGVQVRVTNLTNTQFPDGFTTDQPVAQGDSFQPDPNNPSKLWTNVPSFSGKATLYVDFSNWRQLNPAAK